MKRIRFASKDLDERREQLGLCVGYGPVLLSDLVDGATLHIRGDDYTVRRSETVAGDPVGRAGGKAGGKKADAIWVEMRDEPRIRYGAELTLRGGNTAELIYSMAYHNSHEQGSALWDFTLKHAVAKWVEIALKKHPEVKRLELVYPPESEEAWFAFRRRGGALMDDAYDARGEWQGEITDEMFRNALWNTMLWRANGYSQEHYEGLADELVLLGDALTNLGFEFDCGYACNDALKKYATPMHQIHIARFDLCRFEREEAAVLALLRHHKMAADGDGALTSRVWSFLV